MPRISFNHPRLLFLSLMLLFIGPAKSDYLFAGPLALKLLSDGAGADLTIAFISPTASGQNRVTMKGFVGEMNFQLINNGHVSDFIGYSVDVAHVVSLGQAYEVNAYKTNSPTNGLPNAAAVAYLANTYGASLSKISNAQQRDIQAAALQIAIWSEIYNQGKGFTSGVFQLVLPKNPKDPAYALDSAIAAAATTFLKDAQNQSAVSTWYDASRSGNWPRRGQSVVLADPPPLVPEPPTMLLFAMGLVCLGFAYQRKRGLVCA